MKNKRATKFTFDDLQHKTEDHHSLNNKIATNNIVIENNHELHSFLKETKPEATWQHMVRSYEIEFNILPENENDKNFQKL